MKILLLLSLATGLYAQDPIRREIAAAAAIGNSVERLSAYDAIAEHYKLAPLSNHKSSASEKWLITTDTSPLDDTQTITCALDSDSPIKIGYKTDTPKLIVRFMEGKLNAYIVYEAFLGSESIDVTVRFGKEAALTQEWSVSTDHKAIFVPRSDVLAFLKKLSTVDSLVVRVTPYSQSSVTVSFTTAGIQKVIDVVTAASRKKG